MCRQSMQTKCTAPSRETAAAGWRHASRNASNFAFGHFSRGEGEFVMLDAAAALDMAANPDIVGRIRESHRRRFALHETGVVFGLTRVAAQKSVLSQNPQIAAAADCGTGGRRQSVFGFGLLLADVGEQNVDLADFKSGQRNVEIERRQKYRQLLELGRQHLAVPAGALRKFVIGDHEGAHEFVAQACDANGRNRFHSEQLCRGVSSMAGQDHSRLIDDDHADKADGLDRLGELLDLPLGMRSRASGIRPQAIDVAALDFACEITCGEGGGSFHVRLIRSYCISCICCAASHPFMTRLPLFAAPVGHCHIVSLSALTSGSYPAR